MARRRSLNRRWSRRSINDSAVLDQDSNYIDEEDDTFWRHLPDQTRYSNRVSVNAPSEVFLNSNSRIIDDDDIEATEWWNNLQKTSQDILMSKTSKTEVSHSDVANISHATSHSSAHSITEAIKKKRVMLGAKRKRSGKNPFSQALDLSDITIESEPILALERKDTSPNLSRSVEEGARRSKRLKIFSKSNVKYSPDSNTSTDTEKISKVKPVLFRRPKRKSSSAFSKILSEDTSIVGPSQPPNTNKNATLDEGDELDERNKNTNKTRELMTQPRSPFDKIRGSYKNSDSNIIIESQENNDHQKNFENSELSEVPPKPINDSFNDINIKSKKDTSKISNRSIRSSKRISHQQSSSDKNLKLQLSYGKTSEDDVSLPIRSLRSSKISSSPSSNSETIETNKSNRLSKQRDDTSIDQNVAESNENIQEEDKSSMSNRELLSTDDRSSDRRKKLSIVNQEDKTSQDNSLNKSSSTDSLFEVQKSGYQSPITHEQLNSDDLSDEDKSTDRENEEQVEFDIIDFNKKSNNISEKSIQEPTTRISNNIDNQSLKRQSSEVSQHDDRDQMESNLEEGKSILRRKSLRSSRLKIIDNSLSDIEESSIENRRLSNHKSSPSLKRRTVEKMLSVHEDAEHSELEEDTQNDKVSENTKSFENKSSRLNSSIDINKKNETERSQKLTRNRTIQASSMSYGSEEQESDKENDVTEKIQKSLNHKQTQPNSLTAEDKDERELESTEGQTNVFEEVQESVEQRQVLSMQSISRKLFSEHSESKSVTMSESGKSSRSIRNIDPSAYELPNRTRSDSYSGSDIEEVHENLVVAGNDEPTQSIGEINKDLSDVPITPQTLLPSTSTNQRSKSLKMPEALKTNTLDRYFLSLKNKSIHSNDIQLSQEELQTLENKLKKIKEKTDKVTREEVQRVHEKIAQQRNSPDLKSTTRNNLGNLRNKNKTPKKPINKAYVVDGVFYKQPKLPRPQKWATNRLYKFLWKKMEPMYNLDTRRKSEKFVNYLADVVKVIKRRKSFENYEEDLDELIKNMAKLGIIKTRMDFYNFCSDFLPYAFRVKVTPMLMPGNITNIPFEPDILTIPIIKER